MNNPKTSTDIDRLLGIMDQLRNAETGCPWDAEQDFASIAPYTIEEAYEVADAIERGDLQELKDELGDLLFQVVFHARMANEVMAFSFADVVDAICDKMIRRHPHVFADSRFSDAKVADSNAQSLAWEDAKARERADKANAKGTAHSLMDGVPRGMAELQRAVKLQKRAARVSFDWAAPEPVLDKLMEEITEVREAMANGDKSAIEEEIGDLLFVIANLARQLNIDPAHALRRGNTKFERRFRAMETLAAQDSSHKALDTMSLDEMEALWQQVKKVEQIDE